jgi:putative acetyltransferase
MCSSIIDPADRAALSESRSFGSFESFGSFGSFDAMNGNCAVLRRATAADADAIAAAHVDSIRSIGPDFYPPHVVDAWAAGLTSDLYVRAMNDGEAFFVATDPLDEQIVLGFSTHRAEPDEHRTAVYVRGSAARRGVGSALFQRAEADARASGGTSINIDASLAAVDFYRANGFEETGRGEHRLRNGVTMACVFMRKTLEPIT